MLQTQTVVPDLMELLKKIMTEERFSSYYLVGGTSLALQIGHRNSINIDLFGDKNIDFELFISILNQMGKTIVSKNSTNILKAEVDNVKVDFVNYRYPLLAKPLTIDGIRMVSKIDIAAMKLNAIAGRGSKKDFIDLYFLLKDFTLQEMLDFYNKKYFDGSLFMVQKSLSYFKEANLQPEPKMFLKFYWDKCKGKIIEEVIKLQ
ncbi:nucleotidyl transferase AbiEii/AbiGii toxin family protein [Flavobacterium sp.]|uniref:nucleotidyl transferase AbiEii/AbiGii toxin family protein n=1 Tax=Flavobacterium sp. TaxID=239 RepID=UPI0025CFAEF6|nr:nucleotidyl transferase AbiEii/AbiGii toxin family protein [Flavobacterium sp.]